MTRVLKRDDDNFEESKEEKVGRAIITFFTKIECRLLPPPSEDKEVMKRVESNQSKLSEQFNTGVEELVTFLKCNVETKKVFGKGILIDGPTLAPLVEETIKAINDLSQNNNEIFHFPAARRGTFRSPNWSGWSLCLEATPSHFSNDCGYG